MVLNGMHTRGCCDAHRGYYGADPPIIFAHLAGLSIHLELAQQHKNLVE